MLPVLLREHDDPDKEKGLRNKRQQGSPTTAAEEPADLPPREGAHGYEEGDKCFPPVPTERTAGLILLKEIT